MPMTTKPRSEKRQRTAQIKIRVSPEELANINANAAGHSLTAADFLRRLGQNTIPASTLDHQAVRDLARVAGDLGRLGGLLKLWLSDKERGIRPPQDVDGRSVQALWSDLRVTYEGLKAKIKALG